MEEFQYGGCEAVALDGGDFAPRESNGERQQAALYELVKYIFNKEEALRRLPFNVKVIRAGFCDWTAEECMGFECTFPVHRKNS